MSETQAEHILDMQLRRLTRLEADKLNEELASLRERIADLEDLLASPDRQRITVESELDAVAASHTDKRRTVIRGADPLDGVGASVEITDEPAEVTFSDTGLVARTPADGWKGRLGKDDLLVARIETRTTSSVLAISATGRVGRALVADIPEVNGRNRGVDAASLARLGGDEVVEVLPEGNDDLVLTLVTAEGVIKRVTSAEFSKTKDGASLIALRDGDRVVGARWAPDIADVVMVSSDAQLLRTPLAKVRPQGRSAGGVAGMGLREGASVVGIGILAGPDDVVVVAADNGKAKLTPAAEYPAKGRGTGGVRAMVLKQDEKISAVWVGPRQDLAARKEGDVAKFSCPEGRRDGAGGSVGGVVTRIGGAR